MTTKMRSRGHAAILLTLLGCLCIAVAAGATEVSFFRQQSLKSFLPGTLEGVGIDAAGRLQLGDDVERLVGIDEPFLFAAAEHPDGWVLGTGNSGRVLLVTRDGEVDTLFEIAEPEIFAVWVDGDGTVFAGSSPGGKVYRFEDGVAEEFFDPGETYIWALARHSDGRLLAATGTEGRLYAIDGDGRGEVLYDSEDIHIRALKQLDDGGLLLGTAGEGLILLREPDGSVRTLFDSVHPEVVSFASAPGGVCYAAVLASEASVVDLSSGGQASGGDAGATEAVGESAEGNGEVASEGVVVIEGALGDFTATRPSGFTGSRTDILSIAPSGVVEKVWGFKDETAYSLLWHRDRLWVGTGLEGKLYSFRDREMVLEEGVDERQVVSLLPADPGPVFATTNAAAFYVVADRPRRRGVYTSPALDAGQIARFGTLRWRGEEPSGAAVRFSVRTGMSAEPDRTWSSWSPFSDGGEVSLSEVPSGRYVQWRVELEAGSGRSPRITSVDLSYRQENMAPRIEKLEVLGPGQVLVPANFNPAQQIFEPAHPNREGIFNTLSPGTTEDRRLKGLWKKGFRTLKWKAEDANDDQLSYELTFRPEGRDGEWLQVADELVEDYYSFDATVLPDGDYRFRVVASDLPANGVERSLTAERTTGPVTIDHTPPELISVQRRGGVLEIEVADALSPLREATVSIGAGKWRAAHPVDGLLDGTREVLSVEAPDGGELVLLKIMDGAFNLVTLDLGRR